MTLTTSTSDPVGNLLAVLDLRQIDEDTFSAANVPLPGGRVFGGQVLGQALIAAARTVAEQRLAHSAHAYFIRPGRTETELTLSVERLHDGKSFSTRRTQVYQDGKPILSMIASFQDIQPGLDHQATMPEVPAPETLTSVMDELGSIPDPMAQFWSVDSPFEVRHVDGSIFLGPATVPAPRQAVWMRARREVPNDWTLNAALLTYACDQTMLEPVLRGHGESWMTPGLAVASLDHAIWWHRPVRTEEWFLFVQDSPSAQGGRGLGTASVFAADGRLVASIVQEGMVRLPLD